MGLFCFNQIAEVSEYDIDRIAHRLKGFRSRIYREDWIGQARDLQDQKADGQS
jgi:predicted flap endonuclease-1-like 5' DNA nuclease